MTGEYIDNPVKKGEEVPLVNANNRAGKAF
jgi:hypothetical protein